jgi:delta-aminolevulinic acid dehydratase/porphobilinogen synthase
VAVSNGGTGATSLTGILKGNGTSALSAASAGTDYLDPSSTVDGGTF